MCFVFCGEGIAEGHGKERSDAGGPGTGRGGRSKPDTTMVSPRVTPGREEPKGTLPSSPRDFKREN